MSEPIRFEPAPARALTLVFSTDGGDREVSIPLLQYLPLPMARRLAGAGTAGERGDALIDTVCSYLGDEVASSLTLDDVKRVVQMWRDASEATVGESSGPSES